MEEWEKEVIKKNLPKLIEMTNVDALLLATLRSKSAIAFADISAIKSMNDSLEKSSRLYEIIVTRTDGYNLLLQALQEVEQTGVAKILLDAKQMANNEDPLAQVKLVGKGDCSGNVGQKILVVGNKNCSIESVLVAMMEASASSVLDGKWKTLALWLGTPIPLKTNLNQRKTLGTIETTEILGEILQEWVNRRAKEATLQELINVLKKTDLNSIAESLENTFKISF